VHLKQVVTTYIKRLTYFLLTGLSKGRANVPVDTTGAGRGGGAQLQHANRSTRRTGTGRGAFQYAEEEQQTHHNLSAQFQQNSEAGIYYLRTHSVFSVFSCVMYVYQSIISTTLFFIDGNRDYAPFSQSFTLENPNQDRENEPFNPIMAMQSYPPSSTSNGGMVA